MREIFPVIFTIKLNCIKMMLSIAYVVRKGGHMINEDVDYGMEIIAYSEGENALFMDAADGERYVSTVIRMLSDTKVNAEPLLAGLEEDKIHFVFKGGAEEYFRKLFQKVHVSYSSYRRVKKTPVFFGKTKFNILERPKYIKYAINAIKKESKYLCTSFDKEFVILINLHRMALSNEKYDNAAYVRNFVEGANDYHRRKILLYLREQRDLSYREIGELLGCSASKVYRMVNK